MRVGGKGDKRLTAKLPTLTLGVILSSDEAATRLIADLALVQARVLMHLGVANGACASLRLTTSDLELVSPLGTDPCRKYPICKARVISLSSRARCL